MMPPQLLTDKEKKEMFGSVQEWAEATIRHCIELANTVYFEAQDRLTLQRYYDLYSGDLKSEEYKYVTNPFNDQYEYPAKMFNRNIIKPKIDLLLGEKMTRPFSFNVFAINKEAIEYKSELEIRAKAQQAVQELVNDIKTVFPSFEYRPSNISQSIKDYQKSGFKIGAEIMAADILEYLKYSNRFERVFEEGFLDLLITQRCIYKIEDMGGIPQIRVVNPLYCWFDLEPEGKFIHEANWVCEERWLSISQILDYFHEDLEGKDDFKRLKEVLLSDRSRDEYILQYDSLSTDVPGNYNRYFRTERNELYARIFHVEWKATKRVSMIITEHSDGYKTSEIIDTTQGTPNLAANQRIDSNKWITVVWEGTRIGPDLFVRVREKPIQFASLDNPSYKRLSYTGIPYLNKNTLPKSLVGLGEAYQVLYNVMWYRLETTIAKARGKVVLMDDAVRPKNVSQAVWDYYFDVLGIMKINSLELSERGERTNFNAFQQFDLGVSADINVYLQIMQFIVTEWEDLSGVNKQRLGAINQYETVGGTERAVNQSSLITEYLFVRSEEAEAQALQMLLHVAKYVWRDGKVSQFALGSAGAKMLNATVSDIYDTEFGVFVNSNRGEKEAMELSKQLIQTSLQSGTADLLTALEIITSKTSSEMKIKLEEFQRKMQESQQAAQQEQAKMEQAKMELDKLKVDSDILIARMNNETKLEIEKLKSKTATSNAEAQRRLELEKEEEKQLKDTKKEVGKAVKKLNEEEEETDDDGLS